MFYAFFLSTWSTHAVLSLHHWRTAVQAVCTLVEGCLDFSSVHLSRVPSPVCMLKRGTERESEKQGRVASYNSLNLRKLKRKKEEGKKNTQTHLGGGELVTERP